VNGSTEPTRDERWKRITLHHRGLAFSGLGRLLDPVMQRIFDRLGARATTGIKPALNP
jgi:hypothetical protein